MRETIHEKPFGLKYPVSVVNNIFSAVVEKISRPGLAVLPAGKMTLRRPHRHKTPLERGFVTMWTIPESNRSPLPCHGSALPNELMARVRYYT